MTEMQALDWRPRRDTKTGRVWEIADAITRKTGRLASRTAVINAFVAEGGNGNTASTQYSHWKADYKRRTAEPRWTDFKPEGRVVLHIDSDGRLFIPPELRSLMGIGQDGKVSARIEDGELRLVSPRQALLRLQRMVRDFDRGSGSAADELIAERRAEAQSE